MKMLKQLLVLMLVALLLTSFVSCGDNPPEVTTAPHNTLAYVSDVLKASVPTKAVTNSKYVIDDLTLSGTATLLVTQNGNMLDAKYEYRVEVLNPAGTTDINGKPLMIGLVEDVKYSKGSMVAILNPETGDATYTVYQVVNALGRMPLPTTASVTESTDGTVTVTAKVSHEDIQSVFGVAIGATGDISYQITIKGDKLVGFTATYQTALGQMTVQTVYSYGKVSFDVK